MQLDIEQVKFFWKNKESAKFKNNYNEIKKKN